MKNSKTIALVTLVAGIAFLVGRWSVRDSMVDQQFAEENTSQRTGSKSREGGRTKGSIDIAGSAREAAANGKNLTEEQSRALTREERLEVLRKGALIFDGLKQAAYVRDVIRVLDAEELGQAIRIFGKAFRHGCSGGC